jgi:hypothetical protein
MVQLHDLGPALERSTPKLDPYCAIDDLAAEPAVDQSHVRRLLFGHTTTAPSHSRRGKRSSIRLGDLNPIDGWLNRG